MNSFFLTVIKHQSIKKSSIKISETRERHGETIQPERVFSGMKKKAQF
jgi:hypothetical protein